MEFPLSITLLLLVISGAIVFHLFGSKKSSQNNKDINNLKFEDLDKDKKFSKEVITYKDIVEYSVTERPNAPNFEKGALLRKREKNYWKFAQVFLNDKDEIMWRSSGKPYGRYFQAADMDTELQEAFGEHDLIILQ